jgi:hypothetical protein
LPVGELVFDVVDVWTGRAIGGCRYVPAVPELIGSVAMPALATPPDGRPPLAPIAPVPPRSGRGWFRAGGSDVGPMAPPGDHGARGWTLDLTTPT